MHVPNPSSLDETNQFSVILNFITPSIILEKHTHGTLVKRSRGFVKSCKRNSRYMKTIVFTSYDFARGKGYEYLLFPKINKHPRFRIFRRGNVSEFHDTSNPKRTILVESTILSQTSSNRSTRFSTCTVRIPRSFFLSSFLSSVSFSSRDESLWRNFARGSQLLKLPWGGYGLRGFDWSRD